MDKPIKARSNINNRRLSGDPEEIFADQFALNLLMPEKEVRRCRRWSFIQLMHHFGVPGETLKQRLLDLGIDHPHFQLFAKIE